MKNGCEFSALKLVLIHAREREQVFFDEIWATILQRKPLYIFKITGQDFETTVI